MNGLSTFDEIEFEYPSSNFFEQLETYVKNLPLTNFEFARESIESSGSKYLAQELSELIVRLKTEISRDFTKHEKEYDEVPYFVRYQLVVEADLQSHWLNVRTVLRSKYDHPGRVLYGSVIFRTADDTYVSESSYGD